MEDLIVIVALHVWRIIEERLHNFFDGIFLMPVIAVEFNISFTFCYLNVSAIKLIKKNMKQSISTQLNDNFY